MVMDFREFINELESNREIVKVKEPLSNKYEIPAAINILKRGRNKAILFEQVKGYNVPVVANLLGTRKRFAIALGVQEEEVEEVYLRRRENIIKPEVIENRRPAEVVIENDIDIMKTIPVLTHHEKDAGPYFTAAVTIARDPETGILGMGVHRIQVKDKDKVGIFLFNPPLSEFLRKAENQGRPLEIAIVNGIHPLILMSSILKVPAGMDKFEMAGGLLEKPVNLVKCKRLNLEVPAWAEFVLEGEVLPHKREKEGPFGESSGFYFTNTNPVARIRAISHRQQPIYQALLPFGGEDFAIFNLVWGLENMQEMKKMFHFVRDVLFKGLNYMVIVQIEKTSDDQVDGVAEHLLKNPYTKVIIIVDKDVDIYSSDDLAWAICTRVQAARDVYIKEGLPGLVIDPSQTTEGNRELLTSKLVIDATMPVENREPYEKIDIPASIKSKVGTILSRYVSL